MKKLIVFTLVAFGIYFSATHNVKIEVSANQAHANCEPNCLPPK